MYLNTFKNQSMEELQNERTTVENHFLALATKCLKHENKMHSHFFMHGIAGGSFLFSLAVCG